MEFKSPLSQRIIISFVLLTTVVCGLFALGVPIAIDIVEESLIDEEMQRELTTVIDGYRQGVPLRLDADTQFYVGSEQLPEDLHVTKPGLTEIERDNHDYYVYLHQEGKTPYYLVRSEADFEIREMSLIRTVLIGFLLSIVTSFLVGRLLANKVIAPVKRLTHQVRNREKLLTGSPTLSPDYADDEVGALAKAFDKTITQLQQSLQRETLFTSDVSHELRTPLMIINSSCDLLTEKQNLDDNIRLRVEMIRKAANEMQELVEAFLALARGRDARVETASLMEIIHTGLPTWQQQAAGKGLAFSLHPLDATPHRTAGCYPAILLRTVLNNLVRNAIYQTHQGEISLRLVGSGFELSDSGPGIHPDEKQRVFQPFYRGDAPHQNSLGLGLSLVQRICERENWVVTLEDNTPRGCRFIVSLGPETT